MWLSIPLDQVLDVEGTYRFTSGTDVLPEAVTTPKDYSLGGYLFTLKEYTIDRALKQVIAVISIRKSRGASGEWLANQGQLEQVEIVGDVPKVPERATVLPVVPILAVVAILLGLGLGYMTLTKVEKLVESPAVNIAIIAGSLIAIVLVYKFVIRK